MGGNGSTSSGLTTTESGRRWKTVEVLPNGVKVIEFKKANTQLKIPEESRSPNSVYAMMDKKGRNLSRIAVYGADSKKMVEIHTEDHHGISPHYHLWRDGRPVGSVKPLSDDSSLQRLFDETLSYL